MEKDYLGTSVTTKVIGTSVVNFFSVPDSKAKEEGPSIFPKESSIPTRPVRIIDKESLLKIVEV